MSQSKKLYFTILIAAFSLGLVEVVSRILFEDQNLEVLPPSKINPYEENPYITNVRPYIYFHLPNARYVQQHPDYEVEYRINSLGFRWGEVSSRPPDGMKRLLVIGDSIVEGHGSEIENTFTSLLNRSLRSSGWEVVSCGVQGASPIYYASNIDRYLNLHPDAVAIVLFDNDLYEDRVRESIYFETPFMAHPEILLGGEPLLSRSRFFTLLRRAYWTYFRAHVGNEVERIIEGNRAAVESNDEQLALNALSPSLVAPSLFDREWKKSAHYLDLVVKTFQEQGVAVMITNLSLDNLLAGGAFEAHSMMQDERAAKWARETGIPWLSLLPAVKTYFEETNSRDILFQTDGHPSKKGHQLLEANLRPWLLQNLSD